MAVTWPAKNNYATGDVLTAANMNAIGDDLNDIYAGNVGGAQKAAGKNKIINGDFGVWQRGTSFNQSAFNNQYSADRLFFSNSANPTSATISQQTFAPGTAPVSGYEGTYFARYSITTVGSATDYYWGMKLEDVRVLAGQTATFSFWAKADSARTIQVGYNQNFGSGGSTTVNGTLVATTTLSTSWTRYTGTITIPSISGKTIGSSSYFQFYFTPVSALANGYTLDIWGLQLESGSVATPFTTATGTVQGELAACQRYYWRTSSVSNYAALGQGLANSTTSARLLVKPPVTMRIAPTVLDYANLGADDTVSTTALTNLTIATVQTSGEMAYLTGTVASGLTQYRPYFLLVNNSASGYVGLGAEL